MAHPDPVSRTRAQIAAAADSPDAMRAVFDELVHEHGRELAGRIWWDAFAETDASET